MYVDYALLPPEINSGRMYAGPGSGSMSAAATAWDQLAAELHSTAATYGSVVSGLAGGPWSGPASAAMAAAAHSYVTWLHLTAAQAEQTAGQAKAAVGAHSAALAATVPPPAIAANRALLAQLVATNTFGQNSPAIGTVEGQYAEMWAQDGAAMNGYAATSASASTLQPFTSPPQSANPHAPAAQAAAVAQATGTSAGTNAQSMLSQFMTEVGLANPTSLTTVNSDAGILANYMALPAQTYGNGMGSWAGIANLISNVNNGIGLLTFGATNPGGLFEALNPPFVGAAGLGLRSAVSAGVGSAIRIGAISVPPSWAMPATAAITPVAVELPAAAAAAGPALVDGMPGGALAETMMGTLAGRAFGGMAAKSVANRNRKVVSKSPAAG